MSNLVKTIWEKQWGNLPESKFTLDILEKINSCLENIESDNVEEILTTFLKENSSLYVLYRCCTITLISRMMKKKQLLL